MTGADASTSPFAYLIGGKRLNADAPGFAEAIASAHATHHRPRCLCLLDGIEMYVARLGDGFIVKRMPNTGSQHAPGCPSYEPPPEFSGLGQVLGSAITEDPATGETTLKLDFSLSKIGGRSTTPTAGTIGDSVISDGAKLSLRGLLHYLWDQAELTRWHPRFYGKRSWGTVREHLLQAAQNKLARGDALQSRLYIPEAFSVERREAINARRMAQFGFAAVTPGKAQNLMLLIAEVKEIVPARYGFKIIVKHVPDQAFAIDEQLYRRIGLRFEPELFLWGATDSLHMVMIATFGVAESGLPMIAELSLMLVTGQWMPIEDSFEQSLLERLVQERRAFVKGLRYNMPPGQTMASATLTDAGEFPVPLFIARSRLDLAQESAAAETLEMSRGSPAWTWVPALGAMPTLPQPGGGVAARNQ